MRIEAERTARRAKQDELDSAKAQLTQAQTDLATLSAQHAQTKTELESFKAHSGTSMQEKMEEICRVQKQLHTMQLTLDQAEFLASSTGRDVVRALAERIGVAAGRTTELCRPQPLRVCFCAAGRAARAARAP